MDAILNALTLKENNMSFLSIYLTIAFIIMFIVALKLAKNKELKAYASSLHALIPPSVISKTTFCNLIPFIWGMFWGVSVLYVIVALIRNKRKS